MNSFDLNLFQKRVLKSKIVKLITNERKTILSKYFLTSIGNVIIMRKCYFVREVKPCRSCMAEYGYNDVGGRTAKKIIKIAHSQNV